MSILIACLAAVLLAWLILNLTTFSVILFCWVVYKIMIPPPSTSYEPEEP